MRERVHARRRRQARRHGGHHIRVDHGHVGNVVHVHAHELAHLLGVGDHVVDGDLGRRASRSGNGDGERRVLLGGSHALKRDDVGEFGVLRDDADALGGVHCRAAAHGHDHVRTRSLERRHAILHVLDSGIGLDLVVELPGDARLVQLGRHLTRDAEFHQVRIGAHECFRKPAARNLARNLIDCTSAMIRDIVEHETIDRHEALLCSYKPGGAPPSPKPATLRLLPV